MGVLGPLEVVAADGAPVTVGGPRTWALLALLALNANRVTTVDAIVEAQYGDDPPAGAARAVQAHVSRLRKSVDAVVFEGAGYRLAVDPDDVDALRFERLAADGRKLLAAGAHDKAERTFAAAVIRAPVRSMWRACCTPCPALDRRSGTAHEKPCGVSPSCGTRSSPRCGG